MQLVNGIDLHALLFRGDEYGNREKVGSRMFVFTYAMQLKFTDSLQVGFNYKMKICLQTTNAISYLHDKGFIHNDLKPENIMVSPQFTAFCIPLKDLISLNCTYNALGRKKNWSRLRLRFWYYTLSWASRPSNLFPTIYNIIWWNFALHCTRMLSKRSN